MNSQKEKATKLKDKIDAFKDKFDQYLIEILEKQGSVFVSDIHCPTWLIGGLYQLSW